MESIGEKLRLAREKNTFTLEQVSRDTHVAKRFLKALEDEDFSVFPGETYAMGFLRNYAEYLGLNAEELVALYRNIKIQEQPLPLTELLEKKPRLNRRLLAIAAAVVVVVLALVGILSYRAVSRGQGAAAVQQKKLLKKDAEEFVFQEEVRTKWFKQGDAFIVTVGDKSFRVEVASIGDSLTLRFPGGSVDLALGKERLLDLSSDTRPDIKVVWNDVDRTSTPMRANLGLYRVSGTAAETGTAGPQGSSAPAAATGAPAAAPSLGPAFKAAVIARADAAEPIIVGLLFRDYCLFRFLADTGDKEERFFQKGESFNLDAKNQITLWMSNAGAVKAKIQGKDTELGRLGEVATRKIAWRKDASSGGYVLEVLPLY